MDHKTEITVYAEHKHGMVEIIEMTWKGEIHESDKLLLRLSGEDAKYLMQTINEALEEGWELRRKPNRDKGEVEGW